MHPFGTDSNERFRVLLLFIPISFWLANGAQRLLDKVGVGWPDSGGFLGDPTSAAACFGVLYWVFERWGWRWRPLHQLGLVEVRDLRGTYDGYLESSFTDYKQPYDATLNIRQSWTRISVRLVRSQSRSRSEGATILVNANEGVRLSYEYRNDPEMKQPDALATHRGTAVLVLGCDQERRILEGSYYTSRGRATMGAMHFWLGKRPQNAPREAQPKCALEDGDVKLAE